MRPCRLTVTCLAGISIWGTFAGPSPLLAAPLYPSRRMEVPPPASYPNHAAVPAPSVSAVRPPARRVMVTPSAPLASHASKQPTAIKVEALTDQATDNTAPAQADPAPIEQRHIGRVLQSAGSAFYRDVEYSGSVDAGLQFSTGNTETQDINAGAELIRKSRNWENRARVTFANAEAEGQQTEEEYRAELGSRYNISPVDFVFGEAEYVDDRFSGYEFRLSEVVGYGRQWYDSEQLKWSSKIGAGVQHIKERGAEREDAPIGRFVNKLDWQLTDTLGVANSVQLDVSNLTALRTETAFKNQIADALYLKLAFVTQYLSDVPAGNQELDTDTILNLSYEY